MSDRKLAVMLVHGVESAGEQYAARATELLRSEFTRIAGVSADEALVIEPAFWAPVFESGQEQLSERLSGPGAKWLVDLLDALAARASQGSTPALLAAASTAGLRWLPGLENAHFPTLRWLIVHYLGDAVAYHSGTDGTGHYEQVQAVLARSLHELALKAGDDAPLAVLGHSLGSVVSSDFLYDLQGVAHGTPLYPAARATLDDTPIERGETFGWFYTLGSPLALWAQRHPDFGVPLTVPHPDFAEHHPDQRGEWVNVYDPDDVIASPLRPLSDAWAARGPRGPPGRRRPLVARLDAPGPPVLLERPARRDADRLPARPGLAPPLSCALARARVHRRARPRRRGPGTPSARGSSSPARTAGRPGRRTARRPRVPRPSRGLPRRRHGGARRPGAPGRGRPGRRRPRGRGRGGRRGRWCHRGGGRRRRGAVRRGRDGGGRHRHHGRDRRLAGPHDLGAGTDADGQRRDGERPHGPRTDLRTC